jgi:hypothetical protein
LFRKTSKELSAVLYDEQESTDEAETKSKLVKAARKHWNGDRNTEGDMGKAEVRAFFSEFEPWEDLESADPWSVLGLTRRVWSPLTLAQKEARKAFAHWQPKGEGA